MKSAISSMYEFKCSAENFSLTLACRPAMNRKI